MLSTKTFEGRYNLSNLLSNSIRDLFDFNEVELIPFGFENIFNNPNLNLFINSKEANLSHSSMLVKFLPDYILLKKSKPKAIYFLEIKVSATPVFSKKYIDEIKTKKNNIKLSDIGIIAREAWNAYKTLFPNTIIISATTYNPNILKAQFVDEITCLRCNSTNGMVDCSECPVKKRQLFENSRNPFSTGSGTQHTNIDLSSFLSFKDFFNKLGISINEKKQNELIENIKLSGIKFSSYANETIQSNITTRLIAEGCEWLKKQN